MHRNKTIKTQSFCLFKNRKKISKKGGMELSIGAIVVLIIAITFLSLGLVFMKSMLGKMFSKFEEQISQEPEPPKPSLSYPITLSRNPLKTEQDVVEALKISILNKGQQGWSNRQFIRKEGMCGKVDGVCFIDTGDTTETCNTKSSAKNNDPDCKSAGLFGLSCEKDGKKDPCLMSDLEDLYCPYYTKDNMDPDCESKEGVDVFLICDSRIMEKPFKRNIGPVKTGEYKTNILLLRLKSHIPDDQYLCKIRIFAEDNEYLQDLVVRTESG